MNLADAVAQHAQRQPDEVALVAPGGGGRERSTMTWSELEAAVDAAAVAMGGWGLRAPQRVLLHAENCLAVVVAHLACLRSGLVSTPVNPQSTGPELLAVIQTCGASLLLTDADPTTLPEPVGEAIGVRRLDDLLDAPSVGAPVAAPTDPEALAVLIQTSGSTSAPQLVMLSQRALTAHCRNSVEAGRVGPDDVVLALLPFFHVFGLNAVLGTSLYVGATAVVVPGLGADVLDVVADEQVTQIAVTPTVLFRLMQADGLSEKVRGVRRVVSGAAPLSTAMAREFTRSTGIVVEQAYGLSEAAPGVAATGADVPLQSGTHVGVPLPGVQIRIGDGGRPGREEADPGEIQVRGDNLFSGYWPDGHGGPDADGWFGTGDLGYLADGQLHVVGRLREVVIVSGFNVYPAEVEEVLLQHPGVQAAAVIGHPDEQTGERVLAFVSAGSGRRGLSVADLQQHCRSRLARYKCPREIFVVERMPRSVTGKIRKTELHHLAEALEDEQ